MARRVSQRGKQAVTEKASALFRTAMDRFSRFSLDQRIGLVYLAVTTFFVLFFPLVTFSAIDGSASSSLRFLSLGFWKSSVIILFVLLTLWGWYLSPRFKQFIHMTFGFKDNDHLFAFFLLFVFFSLLLGIEESVSFASAATTTVSVSLGYYVLVVLLLGGMIYSLIKLLDEAKVMRRTDFMGFFQSDKKRVPDSTSSAEVSSLFDSEIVEE